MRNKLTEFEKSIAQAIAEGQNAKQITEWYGITYKDYVNCKRRILRKLKIKRITQIFGKLIKVSPQNLGG